MGREIKFECWNEYGKVMHDWYELVKLNKIHLLNAKNPTYKIRQYTGLKDKNGKELYDGDIYNQWGDVYECDFEQTIYEKMYCLIFDGDFEIIGNIYENPELLEANK